MSKSISCIALWMASALPIAAGASTVKFDSFKGCIADAQASLGYDLTEATTICTRPGVVSMTSFKTCLEDAQATLGYQLTEATTICTR